VRTGKKSFLNRTCRLFPSKLRLDLLDQDRPNLLRHDLVAGCVGVDAVPKHARGEAGLGRTVGDENGRLGRVGLRDQVGDGVVDGIDGGAAGQGNNLVDLRDG